MEEMIFGRVVKKRKERNPEDDSAHFEVRSERGDQLRFAGWPVLSRTEFQSSP